MDGCCSPSRRVVPSSSYVFEEARPDMLLHTSSSMSALDGRPKSAVNQSSLFTSFEDVKLTDEERVFLNAAALGDVPIVRQSLEDGDSSLNPNCVDYMGRSALHLAVDSESMELVEVLMEKISFACVEEALLHAISKGATKIVKVIIEHPNYIAGAEQWRRTQKDPFFRTDEKSQFSPDITPLILAAHYNNHEIIQMFLDRKQIIEKPHPISCQCSDCVIKQNYDSLKRSRSRLHAYRALASPAYMALSSKDPILNTFQLRQEMKKLAQVEKEFKNEYLQLVEQCMNFACELMDLCRGTQEVEAVLSGCTEENEKCDPLDRLKMAMQYEEKKFVAHPNCQQHLTSIYYGAEMGFLQSLALWKKAIMWIVCVPLIPFFCLVYLFAPDTKVANALRCPATKFITHTLSHICFLILLAAATFRLDGRSHVITSTPTVFNQTYGEDDIDRLREDVEYSLKDVFRPANTLLTHVQICLMFWIFGQMWMECKQIANTGAKQYILDNYNLIDFTVLSVYLASYSLRFLADRWIKMADNYYNGTSRARDTLLTLNRSDYDRLVVEIFGDETAPTHSYFMKASRFEWRPDDPEIVSDVLFAVANVLSIARTTYLMPAFEVLGTLQISLGRMLGDITRFLVLFTLVLFAFMVGMHNLYWYYGSQTYEVSVDGVSSLVHTSESFRGLLKTLYSLFWCMFGQVSLDSLQISYPSKREGHEPGAPLTLHHDGKATSIVETVGMFLFALYHVTIIIVLINMLIAMMSHSFEDIQGDCDVEWKFARTRLWLSYITQGSTLPVPCNMLPAPKTVRYVWNVIKQLVNRDGSRLMGNEPKNKTSFISPAPVVAMVIMLTVTSMMEFLISTDSARRDQVCRTLNITLSHNSNADILQRLVRRYLFKLERLKEEGKDSVNLGNENMVSASTLAETIHSPDDIPYSEEDVDPRAGSSRNRERSGGRRLSMTTPRRPQAPQIQLISLPQLDSIQRTLRILDCRLQYVQQNVKNDDKEKKDLDHIRRLMSENQMALVSLVTTLASIQEEVRTMRVLFNKQQANTFQIQPPGMSSAAGGSTSGVSMIYRPKQKEQDKDSVSKVPPLTRMNSRV